MDELAQMKHEIAQLRAEMPELSPRVAPAAVLSEAEEGLNPNAPPITAAEGTDAVNEETFGGEAMPGLPSNDQETFGGDAFNETKYDSVNDETFGEDADDEVTFNGVRNSVPGWGDSSHALSALAQAFETERATDSPISDEAGSRNAVASAPPAATLPAETAVTALQEWAAAGEILLDTQLVPYYTARGSWAGASQAEADATRLELRLANVLVELANVLAELAQNDSSGGAGR